MIRASVPILTVLLLVQALAQAPATPFYSRQATWQDSLLTSLEALEQSHLNDAFSPYESETFHGGQTAKELSIDLKGAQELHLFVTGCPDNTWGVADWGNARLVSLTGSTNLLTAPQSFRALKGRHEIGLTLRSGLYQKMSVAGRRLEAGIHVQADSVIQVPLQGQYTRFQATIGVDDWANTNGTVRFSVVGAKTAARKRLLAQLAEDWTDAASRQQIPWEREDRIFESEWPFGNWGQLAKRYAAASSRVPDLQQTANRLASRTKTKADMEKVRNLYYQSRRLDSAWNNLESFDFDALQSALEDLQRTYPNQYPTRFLARFRELKSSWTTGVTPARPSKAVQLEKAAALLSELESLRSEALLANPLLQFDRLLLIKRKPIGPARRSDWEGYGYGEYLGLPRQSSWNNGTMPNVDRWTNEVVALSPVRPTGVLSTVFRPSSTTLVTDVDLHWDAKRLLFSMPDTNRNWQIHEMQIDGSGLRQLTPSLQSDVHNYDPTYLPNGEVLFLSTAPMQGVPCNAGVIVGMMYKMGPNGEHIRQLTYEQDHDYTPSVLNTGRVLYLRWDYTDTPHVWNRLLMSMNPDGTGQMEYYGANSYWPNAVFFARPIPNDPSKIVGIVTGHHEGRVGELFLFDPAKGRHETEGVVQRIPRKGSPVEAKIEDKLTEHSWPKFLHPWPLSDKYFLVACKPDPTSLWGIYLVDVFDNRVLIKEEEGFALLEPIPLQKRDTPPVIQDRSQPENRDALVYMEDIYTGPGLRGVPRGTVKNLRLITYQFGYQKLAGIDHRVGADGPWEPKRVLGTVHVEADGSALFSIPARIPIAFQPLDAEGKAIALMRSWVSAMPGESVACIGCHDRQSNVPATGSRRIALARSPSKIVPWHGPPHGFSFIHDVQPALDKYCVGCHNGKPTDDEKIIPDLRRDQGALVVYKAGDLDGTRIAGQSRQDLLGKYGAVFDPSYVALRQYVRVGGLESDLHLLPAMEFHADTSELIQMLKRGHHNVALDADAWDRLITWIDLNAPCHGRWSDVTKIPGNQPERRLALRGLYDGIIENWEAMPDFDSDYELPTPVVPKQDPAAKPTSVSLPGWPWTAEVASKKQSEAGPTTRKVPLPGGGTMEFVRIPAGQFVIGDASGEADEFPPSIVTIDKPFWMGKYEISNEQFARFDSTHDSRFEHRTSWIFSQEYLGWPLNQPGQPVVRVSWEEAVAFCRWMGKETGANVTLPTEAQWEYACRAGTATSLSYGDLETDFSAFANLGDKNLRRLADEGWRPKAPDLVAKETRVDDGTLVTAEIGRYRPNAWGLHDMHGNAAEWTRSDYQPYQHQATNSPTGTNTPSKKVVRGGSWRDRPKFCRSASRLGYLPYQKVFNVGFRVILEDSTTTSPN